MRPLHFVLALVCSASGLSQTAATPPQSTPPSSGLTIVGGSTPQRASVTTQPTKPSATRPSSAATATPNVVAPTVAPAPPATTAVEIGPSRLPPVSPTPVSKVTQDKPVPAPQSTPPTPAEKARVFITDSQSWEVSGSAGGANGAFAAQSHGGARPQTAEIVKTFGERCPQVQVNNKQDIADYIVLLDHEGGKGFLRHRNKVAVFERTTGDSIVSHSTLSLGGSVQEACEAIAKHWESHSVELTAAKHQKSSPVVPAASETARPSAGPAAKLSLISNPEGADIEIDGDFVGNTPSAVEVTLGEHLVAVKKAGYKTWERKLKVSGGEIKLNAELQRNE